MELRCNLKLALWLGAIQATSLLEHKELKQAGHLLIRDPIVAGPVAFWPWVSPLIAAMWRAK